MVNRQYLAMKYSQNMPVTASAYIATVTLNGTIAYYRTANSKNRDGQTSQILVVGKAFTLLPRKQQLALITYELIKSGWSTVAVNTEEGYESNISADVDARHTAIATYGKSAVKAIEKKEKLDRKGQIKTGKALKRNLKSRGSFDGKETGTGEMANELASHFYE